MSDIDEAIVEMIAQPVLVLEPDLRVVLANDAFLETFKVEREDTVDKHFCTLGKGQWDIPELRQLLDEVARERTSIDRYRIEQEFETIGRRIMLINARNLDQDGYDRILVAIDDITELEQSRNELIARREFADKLIDSVREGLVVLDMDLRVERVNQSFCEMFEVGADEAEGRLIYELGDNQWDIPDLRRALEEILPLETSFNDFEVTHDFPSIGSRHMLLNARRLDHMPRILLAIRDETGRRRHAEHQKLMLGELQHRVKNILANVLSIASATLRRSQTLDEFRAAYFERIQSLSRTQDLLLRAAEGSTDLRELVAGELSAHGFEADGRLKLEGPAVLLTRGQAQPLAMVIHELSTNAVKYGAFAGSRGYLEIRWHRDDDYQLHLEWQETAERPIEPPRHKGFGTGMIETSINYSLSGETALEFRSEGLYCRISFALDPHTNGRD